MKRFLLCLLLWSMTLPPLFAQGLAIEQYASGTSDKQWALLRIDPPNAIVTLDSTDIRTTRGGVIQAFLPLGMHKVRVEAPFFHDYSASFELSDSAKTQLDIRLVPAFGYASVRTSLKNGLIFIDGTFYGREKTAVCKLGEGDHRLIILRDTLKYCDRIITLESGSKNQWDILDFTVTPASRSEIQSVRSALAGLGEVRTNGDTEEGGQDGWGMVNLRTNVAGATVLVNGIEYGTSPCIIKGLKPSVRYRITVRKDGWRQQTRMVSVKNGEMPDLAIEMKKR